jgi:LysM repeat protein
VKAGDSWFQIAQAQGTTMQHLLTANHAKPNDVLNPGQHIKLPADAKTPKATATAAKAKTAPAQTPAKKPAR